MKIKTTAVSLIGAAAVTAWPFIFIHPICANNRWVLEHEEVHLAQQRRWAIYGLGVGLILWHLLYLLALPCGWNPFRRKWETEAYSKAQEFDAEKINKILKQAPYFLWW